MMSLKRIFKLLAAFSASQGVGIVSQLLVPPLFLHRYANGLELYGEWIVLTAAVTYLSTLNYGIQTYANNEMAILYNRGQVEEAKAVQSSALRLILVMVIAISAVGAAFFFVPLASWLGLRHVSSSTASLTLFLLTLQLIVTWFFSFLTNGYQVIGELHRGTNWQNGQKLAAVLALAGFLWVRASFPLLALTQLASTLLFTFLAFVDIRARAPILIPSLRYGTRKQMVSTLKPSAYYVLFSISLFLIWQGPLLIIEKFLGPASVAVFALSRTIFSMSRQLLVVLSSSIGQDISLLFGRRNWPQLYRLYDLSERVVLLLDPVITVGTLLMCPFLFSVWLHKRALYQPSMCLLMAVVSAVMGIKEHKYVFQYCSNQHEGVAKFSLAAYSILIVVSALMLPVWGIDSFMLAWLTTEALITAYILHLNTKLFPSDIQISTAPVIRLAVVLIVFFALAAWPAYQSVNWPLAKVVEITLAAIPVMTVASYFAFGVKEVQAVFLTRLRRRLQTP